MKRLQWYKRGAAYTHYQILHIIVEKFAMDVTYID